MTDEELKRKALLLKISGQKDAPNYFGIDPSFSVGQSASSGLAPTSGSSAAMTDALAKGATEKPSGGGSAGKPGGGGGGAAGLMGAGGNVLQSAMQAGMMVWKQKQAEKEAKKQRQHEVAQKTGIDKQRAWGEGAQGEVGWWNNLGQLMNRTLL